MTSDDPHKQMAAALGRIPSGLFIITAAHDGREMGMLASWVQQCSFAPPLLSLAVKPGRGVAPLLEAGATITLNILEAAQTDMVAHFGKGFPPDADAFAGLDVRRESGSAPILPEALAYLTAKIVGRHPAGDHVVYFAEVQAGRVLDEGRPMVHVRKNGLHY